MALDPDADLFRLISAEDIPPAVNKIKGSPELLVVITQGCKAGSETMALLMESLGQSKAKIIRRTNWNTSETSGRDLLVCGKPERKELLPALPANVTVDGKRLHRGRHAF